MNESSDVTEYGQYILQIFHQEIRFLWFCDFHFKKNNLKFSKGEKEE